MVLGDSTETEADTSMRVELSEFLNALLAGRAGECESCAGNETRGQALDSARNRRRDSGHDVVF